MSNATCLTCGGAMPPKRSKGSGPQAKYCGAGCRPSSASTAGLNTGSCIQCGKSLAGRRRDAILCSKFCNDVRRGLRLAEPLSEMVCALDGCGVVFVPKRAGVRCCSERHGQNHWNRVSRADGRQQNSPWNERRKAAYHKRRALKLGTQVEDIQPLDIYERDIWLCGLCDKPVDPAVSWPDRSSASLDHIVPLSKGGTHTYENVQLAHLSCNVSKGNRVTV